MKGRNSTHQALARQRIAAHAVHIGEGIMLTTATYLSNDPVEIADAFELGYRTVCQHPREIGVLEPSEVLVIDFNNILFDDHELAIAKINEAAQRGLLVGIHTYYREALKLYRLAKLPNVLVANTHRWLLLKLGRYAKLHGRPWVKIAKAAKPLKGEVNDDYDNYAEEGTAGTAANVCTGV
jgi:hypothetical protein